MSSALHGTRARPRTGRRTAVAAALMSLATIVSGCTGGDVPAAGEAPGTSPSATAQAESVARVSTSLPDDDAPVPVDQKVALTADRGTFETVKVRFGPRKRPLAGEFSDDRTTWTATQRLEPGLRYQVVGVAVDDEGLRVRKRTSFRTEALPLDMQTYPSIAPLGGETVGVGMPVIVNFDVPVTDRAAIERHLSVESSPKQVGAWRWLSDYEVHWRPRTYWKPGTDVTVNADVNSIPAGNGVYGQLSRSTSFQVGDAMVSRVDVAHHRMRVFRNGTLQRTIPISAGKAGFATRSGTKVIVEMFRRKRMDAATTGIDPDDPEYYNLSNVEYAMRVTYTGEFLHAAPWSVASQGSENVSHGCVGMSTANAAWLFNLSKRGDVVEVTGTDRYMTLDNGYGDWNVSFAEWKQGSALS